MFISFLLKGCDTFNLQVNNNKKVIGFNPLREEENEDIKPDTEFYVEELSKEIEKEKEKDWLKIETPKNKDSSWRNLPKITSSPPKANESDYVIGNNIFNFNLRNII